MDSPKMTNSIAWRDQETNDIVIKVQVQWFNNQNDSWYKRGLILRLNENQLPLIPEGCQYPVLTINSPTYK